jgi:hypothetical protein
VDPASPTFAVEEFEYVEASPGLALLRLAGTWQTGDPPLAVALVALSAGERLRLSALPAPPAGDGSWRAAYSASPALLRDASVTFELEPPSGEPIPLPRPVEHGTAPSRPAPRRVAAIAAAVAEPEPEPAAEPEPVAEPARAPAAAEERPPSRIFGRRRQPQPDSHIALKDALAAERHARQAAERTAAEERARAQRAEAVLAEELRSTVGKTEELIARIDGYEHSRVSFEEELEAVRRTHADLLSEAVDEHRAELRELREQVQDVQRELAAAQQELEVANSHIATLNEAHKLELTAARSQRNTAEKESTALEEQLTASRSDAEALRATLEDREALIERARAEAAQANAESAELHEGVARLRDAIAARVRDAATARKRFIRDPAALDRSREELRRDAERIAALERQAEALREAIHSQLPYSLHASPLQEALPLPDGEG